MNFFESEILKGKYFPLKSRDRLRATMVNLLILAGVFIILLHAYVNLMQGYYAMLAVEMLMIFTLMAAYLVFPHYLNINHTSYMILGVLTFFIAMSLVISGQNPELSLFWLASLPIFVFFFLGVNEGIRWSTNMFILLLFIPLFSFVTGVKFVYEWELLSQIVLGYLIISYVLYIIESERSSYEQRLNIALEENKILFKEVHHRTKNNMQVIMGLLETQSFKVDDPKYKKMFEAHIDRLKAMSLMHKNLYTNHSYQKVDMRQYLKGIVKNLQTYTTHRIFTDISPVAIDMKIALNIGLIFNEAVTNSIEHAFSGERGEIEVQFKPIGKRYALIIKDNGRGFDETKTYKSLGMTLIKDLVTTLPNGTVNINGKNGTAIEIYFSVEESAP